MKRSKKRADEIEFLQTSRGELALVINGRRVDASQTKLAVMNALRDHMGHVVPYALLCQILGYEIVEQRHLHTLRQYIQWAKRTLDAHGPSCMIAVVPEVGYALCAIAD